jgi:hypothetical protein
MPNDASPSGHFHLSRFSSNLITIPSMNLLDYARVYRSAVVEDPITHKRKTAKLGRSRVWPGDKGDSKSIPQEIAARAMLSRYLPMCSCQFYPQILASSCAIPGTLSSS